MSHFLRQLHQSILLDTPFTMKEEFMICPLTRRLSIWIASFFSFIFMSIVYVPSVQSFRVDTENISVLNPLLLSENENPL